MRNGLIKQIGPNATFNNVIHLLIKEHYKLQSLKKDLKILEKEKKDVEDKHHLFLQEMMLKRQNIPVLYQGAPIPNLTPPPIVPNLNELEKDFDSLKLNGEIKDDLTVELSLLNGKILTPSQVMKMTKCKHNKTKIERKGDYKKRQKKHLKAVKEKTFKRDNKELEEKSIVLSHPEKFKKKVEI